MKIKYIVLLFLFFVFLSISFSFADTEKPRIAVIALKNTSGDEMVESVCQSITDTIEFTLTQLNKYQILRADYVDVYDDFDESKKFFHDFTIDNAIFGTSYRKNNGDFTFEISNRNVATTIYLKVLTIKECEVPMN